MADDLSLSATMRESVGKGAAREARRNNLVPGVIYGGSEEPLNINVKFNELLKKLNAGRFMSTLINLSVEGKTMQVICRDIQKHIVKDLPTHLDFMRLSKSARIKLFIPVVFNNQDICLDGDILFFSSLVFTRGNTTRTQTWDVNFPSYILSRN